RSVRGQKRINPSGVIPTNIRASTTLAQVKPTAEPRPSTKRSGKHCSTSGAERRDRPPPMIAAYQGIRRSAATIPATRQTIAIAIEPNRSAGPNPLDMTGARCSRGKWPLAANPCNDTPRTNAANSKVAPIISRVTMRHSPAFASLDARKSISVIYETYISGLRNGRVRSGASMSTAATKSADNSKPASHDKAPERKKRTITEIRDSKKTGEKMVYMSVPDYTSAKWAEMAGVDVAVVGDSLAMVAHGHPNTIPASMDMM